MVRRRKQDAGDYLPVRLLRFEPSEWPQEGLRDAFEAWGRARRDYVKAQDWLHTNPRYWIAAIAGIYAERRDVGGGRLH